jgi:hypothetical protein
MPSNILTQTCAAIWIYTAMQWNRFNLTMDGCINSYIYIIFSVYPRSVNTIICTQKRATSNKYATASIPPIWGGWYTVYKWSCMETITIFSYQCFNSDRSMYYLGPFNTWIGCMLAPNFQTFKQFSHPLRHISCRNITDSFHVLSLYKWNVTNIRKSITKNNRTLPSIDGVTKW